jgi:hypothetical protein
LAFALYLWRIEALCLWWDESLILYRAQQDIPFILSGHIDFPGVSTTISIHRFTLFCYIS